MARRVTKETARVLSLVSCIISVMPNENEADIPGEWRDVVHPRRHGMIAVEPARDIGVGVSERSARLAARGMELDADRERVLDHPHTDPAFAALTRPDNAKL